MKSFSGPLYSLLAPGIPFTVLAVFVFLLWELLPISIPYIFPLASGIITAIIASVYFALMQDVKSGRTLANIRGGIIVLGVSYLLFSLFRLESPLVVRFYPGFANVMASIAAVYMWVSVLSLKQIFSARKLFRDYTESYEGESLQKALNEDAGLLRYTDIGIRKTRKSYLSQFSIICLISLGYVSIMASLSLNLLLLVIAILTSGVVLAGFFGIMRREQYHAGEGLVVRAYDRSKRMLVILIIAAFSIGFALLLSADKSLLPFSLVIGFFVWLLRGIASLIGRLFRPSAANVKTPDPEPEFSYAPLEYNVPVLPRGNTWPIWNWLSFGLIALIVAGFIFFLVSPLLDVSTGKTPFHRKLLIMITKWFKEMAAAVIAFIAHLKQGRIVRRLHKPKNSNIQRTAESILGAYSQAKKKDLRQSATLFARLIIWGGEVRNVIWKSSHAPGEYCALLAASAPAEITEDPATIKQQSEAIIRIGELFEQALYSAEIPSDEERKEFKALVEEITSFEGSL